MSVHMAAYMSVYGVVYTPVYAHASTCLHTRTGNIRKSGGVNWLALDWVRLDGTDKSGTTVIVVQLPCTGEHNSAPRQRK